MARYLFLLHQEDANLGSLSESDKAMFLSKFVTWTEGLKAKGHLSGVERLKPGNGGSTVRKKRDTVVVDGPYAEMREVVVGLYIVEASDADVANALAGECPLVSFGGAVEVREVDVFPVRAS